MIILDYVSDTVGVVALKQYFVNAGTQAGRHTLSYGTEVADGDSNACTVLTR